MKLYLLLPMAIAGLIILTGCSTYDDDDAPRVHTSTTTTEESRVHSPVGATTETRSIRTY